ncbi:hypothetical protein COHA_001688 [Chlorella ohadii]|uniref:Uncharacterized protein n=1 Tax=Chlorella ohadii TaxID=2649997 RepID=A0AAD5DYA8_9CHLO|nr:hypothetical protein COHA_001688 [Chlorella ohadii]
MSVAVCPEPCSAHPAEQCPDGCASGDSNSTALCNEQAKCTACIEGYALTDAGECAAVSVPDTARSNGHSLTCPMDCAKCDSKDPTVCLECVSGYGLNGTSADGCVPCIDDLCGDCSSAYTQCKSCSDMNWLSPDGTCQPIGDNCVTANADGNCTECFFGYVVVDGTCQKCDAGDDCAKCDPANLSVCLSCENPNNMTVLRDGKCVPPCKDTNCQTCASPDADTCDECFNAYGLVDGKCVACIDESYSFACDACDGNPEVCTRCASTSTGLYSLVGGQCIFTQFPPADFAGPEMLV